jgi:hypothetical protein
MPAFQFFGIHAGELPANRDHRDIDIRKISVEVRKIMTGLRIKMSKTKNDEGIRPV